jgi:hypothetical protein
MTQTRFPRPCPIPGHPQDDDSGPLAPDSAWSRLRDWHLHAPAERLPLPVALLTWPSAWVLHAAHVPGRGTGIAAGAAAVCTWLAWARHYRQARKAGGTGGETVLRLLPTEAALVAAVAGGWITAAVTWGPLAGPVHVLSLMYLAGAAGGYIWLRRHPAVRAARARRDEEAERLRRKTWWHQVAHQIGLGDFHLQEEIKTHLGPDLLLTSAPGAERVSRVLARADAIAETLAHILGLRYGRIELRATDLPGQLIISVREKAPTVDGPVIHPALDPDSPYADWFGEHRSIRDPVPIGVIPETGEPMELTLFDSEGGKAIGIYSMTGGGKTNILDVIREAVTAMDDAVLVNLNGAGSGDERAWEPLSLLTAAGLQDGNPELQGKISGVLGWVRQLIGDRSETAADTGDSVFQPDRQDPAVVVIADEIDETAKVEGASKALEFLASKQRKAAVVLILAGQRATATWTGGSGVRINLSTVVTGLLARDSESRHAVGAENEIPDISGYSGGEAGFFQIWSTRAKKILARGRGFWIGSIGDQQEHIISKRDPAARPVLEGAGTAPGPAPDAPREQPGSALRERLAHVRELNEDRPLPIRPGAPSVAPGALPVVPGVPPEAMAVLHPLLASGRTSATAAGVRLGVSKTVAYEYLAAMREFGYAEVTGGGRSSGWQLVEHPEMPEDKRELVDQYVTASQYTTLEDLAQAVRDGRVAADDDARVVLEKVRRIAARKLLTVVPDPPPGDGE